MCKYWSNYAIVDRPDKLRKFNPLPKTTIIFAIAFRPLRRCVPTLRSLARFMNVSAGHTPVVPDGFTLHTENTSHILLSSNEAFLNPVQEFNRDISVACIRVWSEELDKSKAERWRVTQEKKVKKGAQNKRLKGPSCPPVQFYAG